MMSLGNIVIDFLSTICCISPDKMVPLWMIILISDFSLHINSPQIYPLTALPALFSQRTPTSADFIRFHSFTSSVWLLSPDLIKKTFMHTNHYAWLPTGTTLKRAFKSPNPYLTVTRSNEPVACDIVYTSVPAIDDGSLAAVIFVGTDTQVTDVYGIKSDKHFFNTLENNITYCGAPHKLISDSAQVIIGNKVQDILCTLCITSWQSEAYQQHQNPGKRCYQTLKRAANRVLDHTGAPDYTWLLCLEYVCFF
jgi:hypothetical protein